MKWAKKAWDGWMIFAEKFGDVMSAIILTALYLTVITPYGLAIRFFSDPLNIKSVPGPSNWQSLPEKIDKIEQYQKQY